MVVARVCAKYGRFAWGAKRGLSPERKSETASTPMAVAKRLFRDEPSRLTICRIGFGRLRGRFIHLGASARTRPAQLRNRGNPDGRVD